MSESLDPEEAVVTWTAGPNHAARTMDFEFEVVPPVDALVDVQRRIPPSGQQAARQQGVSETELDGPITVAENVPIRQGRGSWRDYFCEPGVTYQYRVRAHDIVTPADHQEPAISPA